jgi:hypothetical protein
MINQVEMKLRNVAVLLHMLSAARDLTSALHDSNGFDDEDCEDGRIGPDVVRKLEDAIDLVERSHEFILGSMEKVDEQKRR